MKNFDSPAYRIPATTLNIKLYYGTLAKAEGREKEFSTKMYVTHKGSDERDYMTHINPRFIAEMKDDDKLVFITTVNGTSNVKTYKKESLMEFTFNKTRDAFLKNVRTRERAIATGTESIYNMLYNSAKRLKDEEDAYYDKLAQEDAERRAYEQQLAYGHCDDFAWQNGVN